MANRWTWRWADGAAAAGAALADRAATSRSSGPLAVAIALATGIAVAPGLDRIGVAPGLRWLAAAAVVVAWRRAERWRGLLLLAAGLALGAARGARPEVVAPPGVTVDDRTADRVIGVVQGPVVHGPRGDGARLDTGAAAIWLWSDQRLVPGERVAATGAVRTPRGLRDPAVPDRGDAARARGAELELTARQLERLGDAGGPGAVIDRAWRWAGATQAAWAHAIDSAGGDPIGRAALRGIAVGDRGEVPPALDQRWRAVGIYHVLSVSGLHLAVVAMLAFRLLRRLVAASPWGGRTRPARWAAPPALVLAIGYTMITGAQLATLRSLIAVALVLIAQFLDRPLRLIDAIGVAAIAILAWRPADLLDPSFQLSFVAALTLALGAPAGAHGRGVRGWLMRGLVSSTWVAITTAPLTAYHFHQVAAGGVLGNLLLTPPVELVALPLGLAGAVLGIAPAIAVASWIVGLADRGAGLLAEVTPIGHVVVASAAVMAVGVALSLALAALTGRRGAGGVLRAALWLALCLVWSLGRSPPPPGALRVTFLDVGQGDAALIELPDGAVWLIDAGGNPGARDLAQAAAPGRAIDRVLAAYDHTRIALAIVSHPHPDHYLGLAAIEAPIDELWSAEDTGAPPRDASATATRSAMPGFTAIAAGLAARGTRWTHPPLGVARRQAGVELAVWAPRYQPADGAPLACAADPVRTVNDNSLVVALRYRGRTLVFTGDIEAEGEDAVVAAGLGAADVVKVPHHGSPTSSTATLVAATHPALAVISCGAANAFGFPSPAVVERWQAAGADIARTDRDGAITVTIDAGGRLAIDRLVR
ncbi:MAG TPA: ComEC/Rec2 family competence protein [Kofleriaceae bacterium]|nr:ComEC/Rec2 family competence protein [Kofleriaceae bacterium]